MNDDGRNTTSDEDYLSVRHQFMIGQPQGFFDPLDHLQHQSSVLHAPLEAFRQNLSSALMVGSIPFQLSHSNILRQRYSQILTAERIRALKLVGPGEELNDQLEQGAEKTSELRMKEELADPSIISRHAHATLRQLQSLVSTADLRISADELLRQVLVMSWGAFETLANDLVRLLVNIRPGLVREIFQTPPYKDLLTSRTILTGLENAKFNLATCMGDFVSDLVSLDSLEKIRGAARAIFQSPSVDEILKDSRLWIIAQQRHLLVHRRGIVDTRYCERTGDTTAVGEKLIFDALYVETSMSLLRDVGCLMYRASRDRLESIA